MLRPSAADRCPYELLRQLAIARLEATDNVFARSAAKSQMQQVCHAWRATADELDRTVLAVRTIGQAQACLSRPELLSEVEMLHVRVGQKEETLDEEFATLIGAIAARCRLRELHLYDRSGLRYSDEDGTACKLIAAQVWQSKPELKVLTLRNEREDNLVFCPASLLEAAPECCRQSIESFRIDGGRLDLGEYRTTCLIALEEWCALLQRLPNLKTFDCHSVLEPSSDTRIDLFCNLLATSSVEHLDLGVLNWYQEDILLMLESLPSTLQSVTLRGLPYASGFARLPSLSRAAFGLLRLAGSNCRDKLLCDATQRAVERCGSRLEVVEPEVGDVSEQEW